MHWAAAGAHAPVVQLLLNAGAPLDAVDDSGRLPLHICALAGDGGEYYDSTTDEAKAAMATLLAAWRQRHDGSCWRGDQHGLTPLHLAASAGQRPMVEALLAAGADPKVRVAQGVGEGRRGCRFCTASPLSPFPVSPRSLSLSLSPPGTG